MSETPWWEAQNVFSQDINLHTSVHIHTNPPLAVVNTLVVSPPFPLLSCTAPDKQHQKQHSHQPQRKHPVTCSGIYFLSPPSPVCVCLSIPPTVYPSKPLYLHPNLLPYSFTFCLFFLSVLLIVVDLCLAAAMATAVGKVFNQQVVSGNISPWQVGVTSTRADIVLPCHFLCQWKFAKEEQTTSACRGCQSNLPPTSNLCICREAVPHRVSIKV